CLAIPTNAPGITITSVPVPVAHPQAPGIAEGRAYNQHLYVDLGAGFAYQTLPLGPSGAATVTGAFHRIHLTRSMNSSTNRTCSFPDMSDQIHCLVEASPCSIGLAEGRPRPSLNPNTSVIKINKQSRLDACIQAMAYPLWHKVYLNSIQG